MMNYCVIATRIHFSDIVFNLINNLWVREAGGNGRIERKVLALPQKKYCNKSSID